MDKKNVTRWDLFAQNMELLSGRCLYELSRHTDYVNISVFLNKDISLGLSYVIKL